MGAIWAFVNSPIGMSIVMGAAGAVYHFFVKDDARDKQIKAYAAAAFEAVELAAKLDPRLKGAEKYKLFVQKIVNSLQADKAPELSAKEVEKLKQLAADRAYLAKP